MSSNAKLPVIFWMHGGGYIAGDKQYKNPLLAKIAEKVHCCECKLCIGATI